MMVFLLVLLPISQISTKQSDEAVRNLQEVGGRVIRSESLPGKPVVIVDLHRLAINDSHVAALADMKELEVIDLSYTKITDKSLEYLKSLKKVKQLSVYGTGVTDKGLENLKDWVELESLFAAETAIGDKGLVQIEGFHKLHSLELDHTQVTDGGLLSLGKIKSLRRLELHHNSGITDKGLDYLKSLGHLTWIDLHKTRVTALGAETLTKAFPKTRVVR
jgi:Leucine-rich repeat (LRR) protein